MTAGFGVTVMPGGPNLSAGPRRHHAILAVGTDSELRAWQHTRKTKSHNCCEISNAGSAGTAICFLSAEVSETVFRFGKGVVVIRKEKVLLKLPESMK